MRISIALERALKAVEAGEVVRRVSKESKLIGPKGIGAQSLWLAKMNDFIKDGPDSRVGMTTTTKQILTDTGQAALNAARATA